MQQAPNTFAERVLSKGISDPFCEFFTSILCKALAFQNEDKTRPVFIVVITRRCFVLFFSYYEMLCWCIDHPSSERPLPWKDYSREELIELAEAFKNCVITDNAAWAMAYDMVKNYATEQVFPQLIVTDELLFHGRALNGFLYGLEKRLLHAKFLYQDEFPYEISDEIFIQDIFLGSLAIRVANRNVGSSVLLPRYQENLAKNNPNIELPIEDWRNRSIAYAQYVSVCGINNTGFTLGIAIPAEQDQGPSSCDGSLFTKVGTSLQDIGQNTWLYFYPSAEQPRMVCTVRCKQSQTDKKKNLYVPFLILDHIDPKQLLELHRQLVQEAQASGKQAVASLLNRMMDVLSAEKNQKKALLVPWVAQTTDLVLTSWLMKRFLRDVKGINQQDIAGTWNDAIDWEQLAANFRLYDLANSASDKTIDALKELWGWEPSRVLEDYFSVYTVNAKPLAVGWMDHSPVNIGAGSGEDSPLVQCLEDTIARIGLEAERNAYTLYGSGLSFSDEALSHWGDDHSLDTLLGELHKQTKTYAPILDKVNLYEAVAIITQAMDLGLLGMNTILDKQPCEDRASYRENPRELYTRQRAGEASLFLLPIRYRNFLPVLSEIQEKRGEDFEGAAFDLGRFVGSLSVKDDTVFVAYDIRMPVDQLRRSLCSAYEMLVSGGQKIKEWQCSLHNRRVSFAEQEKNGEIDRGLKTNFLWAYRNL